MARTSSSSLLFFTFTFLSSLSFLPIPSLSSTTDTFAFGGCTQDRYVPGSPYESNLNSLLTSLVNSAAYSSYNNYTIVGSSPQDVVYGLYQCRGDLSMMDCATCVSRAVSQLGDLCLQICGGALQLPGCYVKYDNTAFLGVEDKTVVSEKCGPSVECHTDAMNLRDAVLSGLARNDGPYRVGGSGNVQGLAQCVGGLSIGECQDCVSEAIERLKSDCGTADYGDIFLAKCYVRYTTGGPQVHSKSHNGKSTNKVKKSIATIAGSLAGVALIISFLASTVKKLKKMYEDWKKRDEEGKKRDEEAKERDEAGKKRDEEVKKASEEAKKTYEEVKKTLADTESRSRSSYPSHEICYIM